MPCKAIPYERQFVCMFLSDKSKGAFRRKQDPFRRLKLPKRAMEKRIFRYLRNLTTVKSEVSGKD